MKKRVLSIILTLCMVLALVPIMPVTVSAASAGYTFLAGTAGANDKEGPAKLIDGDTGTKWCVTSFKSAKIIFETTSAINVSGYSITTGNDNAENKGRNPKSWVLYGCNDYSESTGTGTWGPIHSVTDDAVLKDKNYTTYSYVFDKTTTAYKYFKLEISAIQSGTVMQMSEFELTDCEHTWTKSTTNPTCTEGGYTRTSCTVCNGVKEVSNYTDPLGHDFGEDGICTRCRQHYCTFDISKGTVRILDDETNQGKLKVLYGSEEPLLNIDPETLFTVTGSTTQYELKVETAKPVTIKAKDLRINMDSTKYSYAMLLHGKDGIADVTLILEGTNTLKGGKEKAGITAGKGKKLTIEGDGSLTATGGPRAAGIGGECNSSCGIIIINSGTVTANGGSDGAGIGGGGVYGQSTGGGGGTVIITGGTVNATGNNGADIGGGVDNNTGTVIITGGNVTAANNNKTGNAGIKPTDNGALEAYGEFTIPVDLMIPEGTLIVPEGVTMTIPEGVELTNDSTITNSGTIANNGAIVNNYTIINDGTIANNGAIYVNGTFEGTADNLYYPLTVTNATANGDTSEYNGTTYAKLGSEITLSYTVPEGYYFTGWNVNSTALTVADDKFTMPAEPLTVTAQFKYANYTVKFNTVGGSNIEDKTNVKWSDTVLDGVANPTKTGYSFVGWKCGDKLVTATTTCGELASADDITEIVLVARWTDNSLFVTKENLMRVFTPNGEGIPDSIGKLVFGKNSNKAAQEWYILGQDSGVTGDNTIIFAASPLATNQKFALSKSNITDSSLWSDCVYTESTPQIVSSNHYGASELRKALKAMAVDSNYFTAAEQSLMNVTTVTTSAFSGPGVTVKYTTKDKLYALQSELNSQKLWAGSDDSTALAISSYWNSGESFWLRSPHYNSPLSAYPGCFVDLSSIVADFAVQPAANLNLTNVLFASATTAAYDAVSSGSITAGTAMTLRLDGSDKAIGTVIYDTADGLILAKKSANAEGTVSLVVQSNNGTDNFYYSLPVDGTAAVSAEQIKTACGISDLSLADCEIWLETTIDNVSYAKTAEEKDIEIISSVEITGVKPVAGEELSTNAVCATTGIATTAPAITYTSNGAQVTGTANWNTTYKAEVTLGVIATGDTLYMFGDTVSVIVDGEVLTSAIAPNSDGTLTVSKEFTTGNRKLVSVTAPTAPTTFTTYYGFEGYDEILTNGGNKELGKLATVTFNGTSKPTSANMNVIWTVESGNGVYNKTPYAKNTFRWTILAEEFANYDATDCAGYDAATGTITGTVEITNKAATPVTITGTDTTVYYTGAEIDVSQYFEIDQNAGAATYSILGGGNGVGTLDGKMLTVNELGVFPIMVSTAADGIYSRGAAVAVLTVKYDINREYDFDGNGTADIIDLVRLKKITSGVAESNGASPDLDGSGKPDAADLTIFKKFLFGNINVKSAIKLRAAVERLITDPAGGRITLDNDIDLGAKSLEFYNSNSETPSGEITLDLNSHMLSGTDTTTYGKNALILSVNQTALNIENGALELMYTKVTNPNKYVIFNVNGILRLKNCMVNSNDSVADSAAVFAEQSSVELENCDLFGGSDLSSTGKLITVYANGATITATGDVSAENYFLCRDFGENTPWSLTLKAGGIYSFNGTKVNVTEDTTYSSGSETLPGWIKLY